MSTRERAGAREGAVILAAKEKQKYPEKTAAVMEFCLALEDQVATLCETHKVEVDIDFDARGSRSRFSITFVGVAEDGRIRNIRSYA